MASSSDRILATHVGSLVRPPKLVEFLKLIEAGEPYDKAAYEACLKGSVAEVVRQQVEAGVDIVSDGEFGKGRNWAFYVHERLTGIEHAPGDAGGNQGPADLGGRRAGPRSISRILRRIQRASGSRARLGNRFVVNGPITYNDTKREARHRQSQGGGRQGERDGAFLPVVAPASALPDVKNEHYADEKKLLFALADCLRQEYKAIVDAGLYVQIDDAFLPYMQEKMVPPMSEAQYRAWAQLRIDALNHALRGIPEERSRYHICWGSWNGPHAFDVPLKDIADLLLQVKVGAYSVEQANPRHEHEWTVWQNVKLPAGQEAHPRRHQPRHQHRRASRAGGAAAGAARQNRRPRERHRRHRLRLRAEPVRATRSPSIMWAKLRSLSEGARLASAELWGKRSAA